MRILLVPVTLLALAFGVWAWMQAPATTRSLAGAGSRRPAALSRGEGFRRSAARLEHGGGKEAVAR